MSGYCFVIAAVVSALFTAPLTNLHSLFLQPIVAQQLTARTSPPEPEEERTIALPASNGTKPVHGRTNQTEPCISTCPPGQICIQMCKPIGQPETLTITPEPSPSGTATDF
jgi:hypothetical protein